MINVTLNNVVNLQDTTTAQTTINNNNTAIVNGFVTAVNKTGDQMLGTLDMNSFQIFNLPPPATGQSPLRLQDLNSFIGGGIVTNIPPGGTTGQVLAKNSNTNFDVKWSSESAAGVALSSGNDTNVTLSLSGSPTTALLTPATVTAGWTGNLAVARGGTGTGTASGTALDNITGFASNGLINRTGAGAYGFVTPPAGAIVGTTDTQTLTNKTIIVPNNVGILFNNAGGTADGQLKEASGGSVFFLMGTAANFYVTDNSQNPIFNVQGSGVGGVVMSVVGTAALSTAQVVINSTLTSSSPTTGSLITAGGFGASGAIFSSSSIKSISPSAGVGYATGAGGTVTQATNKSTAVTLNKVCGQITMNNAALASGGVVSFTVNNSTVVATDVIIIHLGSVGSSQTYQVMVDNVASGTFLVTVRNYSGGSLSEAIVLNFSVLKSVTS